MTSRASSDTVQLKVRLKELDRAALEVAARERGVSLNTEIVDRLRGTFHDQEGVELIFGSQRNFELMKLIASVATNVTNFLKPGSDWITDPYTFDQVSKALTAILDTLRPEMPTQEGVKATASGSGSQGQWEAHKALEKLRTDNGSSLSPLVREDRLSAKKVATISPKLLPFVEEARSRGISVLQIYKEAQMKADEDK